MCKQSKFFSGSIFRRLQNVLLGVVIAVISITAVSPVSAETPVERVYPFTTAGATPKCDGFVDYIEDAGKFFVEGVQYLGEKTLYTVEGLGSLIVEGSTDKLFDEINGAFADAGSLVGDLVLPLLEYTPLGLLSVLVDVLPEGAVTDFLDDSVDFSKTFIASAAGGVVTGLNPLEIANTAINDFAEIATDIGNVLINLDDPLSAANEFLKLNQKWTGVGALTYMITDGPDAGLKKALSALHRQFEIATTYYPGAGSIYKKGLDGKVLLDSAGDKIIDDAKTKIAGAILAQSIKDSKAYIKSLPDGSDVKKSSTALVTAFSNSFMAQVSDPNFDPSSSNVRHPIYSAKLTSIAGVWGGDDHNSGGAYDFGFFKRIVEDKPGCISLGDFAYPGSVPRDDYNVLCNVEDGRDVWWSRPTDYKLVYGDNCTGGSHDRTVWQPVCKEGYTSVGFVEEKIYSGIKPLPNRIACLKNDPRLLDVTDGVSAGLDFVANDDNSGS